MRSVPTGSAVVIQGSEADKWQKRAAGDNSEMR
jgi:hypothetical protein